MSTRAKPSVSEGQVAQLAHRIGDRRIAGLHRLRGGRAGVPDPCAAHDNTRMRATGACGCQRRSAGGLVRRRRRHRGRASQLRMRRRPAPAIANGFAHEAPAPAGGRSVASRRRQHDDRDVRRAGRRRVIISSTSQPDTIGIIRSSTTTKSPPGFVVERRSRSPACRWRLGRHRSPRSRADPAACRARRSHPRRAEPFSQLATLDLAAHVFHLPPSRNVASESAVIKG